MDAKVSNQTEDRKEIAKNLKKLLSDVRKSLGLTQEELAAKLNLAPITIKRYETAQIGSTLNTEVFVALSSLIDTSPGDLLNRVIGFKPHSNFFDHFISSGSFCLKGMVTEVMKELNQELYTNTDAFLLLILCYLKSNKLRQLDLTRFIAADFLRDCEGRVSKEFILIIREKLESTMNIILRESSGLKF